VRASSCGESGVPREGRSEIVARRWESGDGSLRRWERSCGEVGGGVGLQQSVFGVVCCVLCKPMSRGFLVHEVSHRTCVRPSKLAGRVPSSGRPASAQRALVMRNGEGDGKAEVEAAAHKRAALPRAARGNGRMGEVRWAGCRVPAAGRRRPLTRWHHWPRGGVLREGPVLTMHAGDAGWNAGAHNMLFCSLCQYSLLNTPPHRAG
jgi:hypothetical protein